LVFWELGKMKGTNMELNFKVFPSFASDTTTIFNISIRPILVADCFQKHRHFATEDTKIIL
jgi:hypothetical protein